MAQKTADDVDAEEYKPGNLQEDIREVATVETASRSITETFEIYVPKQFDELRDVAIDGTFEDDDGEPDYPHNLRHHTDYGLMRDIVKEIAREQAGEKYDRRPDHRNITVEYTGNIRTEVGSLNTLREWRATIHL